MGNHVTLTISDITGWHEQDVAALSHWLSCYANLLGHHQEAKAVRCVRNAIAIESGFPAGDINDWLHTVIRLIFYELALLLKREKPDAALLKQLAVLETSFSPNINFAASSFNNLFDQIDFEQEREVIVAQAVTLLS